MEFLSTLIIAVLITSLTIPLLQRLALRYSLVDIPNERKVHSKPIARVGGVAMALGAFVPLIYWQRGDRFLQAYLLSALVLVAFGLADDLLDISPAWKFLGQSAAAAIIIGLGGVQVLTLGSLLPEGIALPPWGLIVLTLVAIVGVTNAINLSDGLDGLAGGISLLGIAFIGFLAWQEGDLIIGLIAVALCGAIFGFLRYNTFPASIFMGDTGSQLLGFSAIALALSLTQGNTPLSPAVPLLILGFPVLDTLSVMTGRIIRGRSPFSADKSHFHHSLLALGLHQTESVLVIYVIQVTLIVAAYLLRFYSDWLLLGGYLFFSATVLTIFAVTRRCEWEPKRTRPVWKWKLYLRFVRDRTSTIKYLYRGLYLLYPAMLVAIFAISGPASGAVALSAVGAVVLMALVHHFLPERFKSLLHGIVYLMVPYGVYLSERWIAGQPPVVATGYNLLFGLLALLNILVSKLTRRKEGFKSTPLDFLIFFLAVAPLLPVASAPDLWLGLVAAKVIILYYSWEVLMAEMRGAYTQVVCGIVTSMAALVLWWL